MELIKALRTLDLAQVAAAVKANPAEAQHPRAICEAANLAFLPAVQLLGKKGADLNASWHNYRPLHALIQTDPHAEMGKPGQARLACMDWLLEHGADPEQLGAWPLARVIIVAAFVGSTEYVERLRKAARVDGFVAAALGDIELVKQALQERPDFAREHDAGGLTALQCAVGSRLPEAKPFEVAELLLDAGADPNARTRSWGESVNAGYFAARTNCAKVFELLLDRGAEPTDALSHAVWGKHFDLAEMALAP